MYVSVWLPWCTPRLGIAWGSSHRWDVGKIMTMLLREYGMTVGLRSTLMERCMRCLDHVCRMDVCIQPFVWGTRPFCGTKQHW